uniref:Thioredoxin domain-containing protein n=1 Tax=Macrostomum lignano TaxID=282301 RepID=A0A1I8JM88_9PLAT
MAFRLSAYLVCCIALAASISSSAARVVEVGEEFIGRDASQAFLVKFYAPWCGHCRNMEPAYEEVSDRLAGSPVTVARIDATVHQAAAAHFRVRALPDSYLREGDTRPRVSRVNETADEIVKFVNRVSGEGHCQSRQVQRGFATSVKDPFFLFIGSEESKEFPYSTASRAQMRTHSNKPVSIGPLYAQIGYLGFDLCPKRLDREATAAISLSPAVLAFKDNGFVLFRGQFDNDSL